MPSSPTTGGGSLMASTSISRRSSEPEVGWAGHFTGGRIHLGIDLDLWYFLFIEGLGLSCLARLVLLLVSRYEAEDYSASASASRKLTRVVRFLPPPRLEKRLGLVRVLVDVLLDLGHGVVGRVEAQRFVARAVVVLVALVLGAQLRFCPRGHQRCSDQHDDRVGRDRQAGLRRQRR